MALLAEERLPEGYEVYEKELRRASKESDFIPVARIVMEALAEKEDSCQKLISLLKKFVPQGGLTEKVEKLFWEQNSEGELVVFNKEGETLLKYTKMRTALPHGVMAAVGSVMIQGVISHLESLREEEMIPKGVTIKVE